MKAGANGFIVKKKVLWLCNIVLPDFSQEFGIKRNNFGGWMTGMLHGMEKEEGTEVSLCFPIIDKNRLKEGTCKGHDYYTFLYDVDAVTYTDELIQTFEDILEKSRPDLVHIWGTEYPHTTAMLLACQRKGMLERAVVNIQGLVSVYSKHYMAGIPQEYREWETECGISMEEEYRRFEERGKCEVESLKLTRHVIGRTDWDRACAEAINPQVQYHFCNEILRDIFYEYAGCWDYGACQKHAIFVSQASYPIKGFHYLLEALPVVIRKYPDTHVYVAGVNAWDTKEKNPYSQYIIEIMERFGLTERISFLGNLNEIQMIQQYRNTNVFVSASVIENESNSLSEAKMLGVPSVASFAGGVGSRIDSGTDGFLYPYDEPSLLAYYINRIFENKDGICERFSKNSAAKMLEVNHPMNCVGGTKAIYKEIAG